MGNNVADTSIEKYLYKKIYGFNEDPLDVNNPNSPYSIKNILKRSLENKNNNLGFDKYKFKSKGIQPIGSTTIGGNNVSYFKMSESQYDKFFDADEKLSDEGIKFFGKDAVNNGFTWDKNSGTLMMSQKQSWLQQNAQNIQLGAGIAFGGLNTFANVSNMLENRKTAKMQREALAAQTEAFKQQTTQAREEYDRLKSLRAKLNSQY